MEGYKAIETRGEQVNHPAHYSWLKDICGIEPIDICRHLDFNCGNAVKYILRAGKKTETGISDKDKAKEDIRKAIFYLQDYLENL